MVVARAVISLILFGLHIKPKLLLHSVLCMFIFSCCNAEPWALSSLVVGVPDFGAHGDFTLHKTLFIYSIIYFTLQCW